MSPRALIELLCGKGAHVDPMACVDIGAEFAPQKVAGFPHSIAQLVFHMNLWMDYELRRIRGERPKYPEHNSESFPATATTEYPDWKLLVERFSDLLTQFAALANSSSQEMQREIESGREGGTKLAGSQEAVLWQMVAHNSYHVGQIAMMRQMLKAWPPRRRRRYLVKALRQSTVTAIEE